ncbi:MAG: class I SAM-dependent methyltransferase [Acidimicrobiia bacterium]
MSVIDLGGTTEFWKAASLKPANLVIVNLEALAPAPDIETLRADACALAGFNRTFDLVFSNSLLEHVGGWQRRLQLAEVIHRLAPNHSIQTPYRYFPIEPHWLFPGFQFLPLAARVAVARRWRIAHQQPRSRREAIEQIAQVDLVGRTEMSHLFPDSEILIERFAGLPKSLVAVKH